MRAPPSMTAWMPASTWPGRAVSRSTPKGFDGQRLHARHLLDQLVGPHRRRAERADAAGLGDGGDEPVVRHPAHAGEHHRVLDLEELGQSRLHAGTVGTTRDGRSQRARVGAVGAGPGEELAVPAAGGERGGAGLVLEQPAGEAAPGPVAELRPAAPRPGRAAVARAPATGAAAMRWSGSHSRATARPVARGGGVRPEGAGGEDGPGGQRAGQQGLADALAGHRVARAGRVADEQGPARRRARPGRCGPGSATPCAGAAASAAGPSAAAMWGRASSSGHSAFMSWMRRSPSRAHAEADVGPAAGQRERPGVARAAGRARTRPTAGRAADPVTPSKYWRNACHSPR